MSPAYRPWLLFALAACAAAAIYHEALFAAQLGDEKTYAAAIDAVARGQSPSLVPGWLYPRFVAQLGAWLARPFGIDALLHAVRAANFCGTLLVLTFTARRLSERFSPLLVVALLLSPFGRCNLIYGNVSGLLTGATLGALMLRPPWLRTLVFSLSLVPKPYGLAVWLTRPVREWALPVLGVGAIYSVAVRGSFGNLDSAGNAALVRPLHELGLPISWQLIAGAALLIALGSRENALRGFCLAWLSLPLVWQHTTILLLVPWAAVTSATLRGPRSEARSARLIGWGLAGVVLSTTKWWGIPDGPRWLSALMGLLPSAAAIAIAVAALPCELPLSATSCGAIRGSSVAA